MSWEFKIIDHTADIAVEISGDSYRDLLNAAFDAWKDSAAEPIPKDDVNEQVLEFSEFSMEELLVSFLSELNYLFFVKKWLPAEMNILQFENLSDTFSCRIHVTGRNPESIGNIIKAEIKAVTFHQMEIQNVEGKLTTKIIFDI